MGIVGEDGRPVEGDDPKPEEHQGEGEPKLPQLVVSYTPTGDLSIAGPADIRTTLAMLDEAKNIVLAKMAGAFVLSQIAQRGQGIQRPGLRDVVALGKDRLRL